VRRHWQLSEPLFKRRRTIVPRIPHFWPLVFDEAPPEIENHIQPSDSRVFAEYLQHFDVERFELETEPRSILLSFEFAENPYFEDKKLEKRFWWRKSLDGWSGLVSEPVAIQWKAGNDLTNGLTNATLELWKRWKELGGEGKRKGFSSMQEEPTYAALKTKLEESDFSMHSFFTLFTFVSTLRYVTAEESKEADEKEAKEKTTKTNGAAKAESDEKDEDGDGDDLDVMACPHGDDLATVLVEELYSNAIKYFSKFSLSLSDSSCAKPMNSRQPLHTNKIQRNNPKTISKTMKILKMVLTQKVRRSTLVPQRRSISTVSMEEAVAKRCPYSGSLGLIYLCKASISKSLVLQALPETVLSV